MKQIHVIARAAAKPGKQEEVRRLLRGMLAPTHAEEGCKLYELYESHEPGRFYLYELWESKEALDGHAATPHFKHLGTTLKQLLSEPFEVNLVQPVHE